MPLGLKNQFYLDPCLQNICSDKDNFNQIFNIHGQMYRHLNNHKTLRFTLNNKSYFLKLHYGIGWKRILKSFIKKKYRPLILGAKHEWKALLHLKKLGIPTPNLVGYGQKGWNPARLKSFVITEELTGMISVNDLCVNWAHTSPSLKFKRQLISRIADIISAIHKNGINHGDLCLCHFYLPIEATHDNIIFLIDLQKASIQKRIVLENAIADIVLLNFSSLPLKLSRNDLFCFIKNYAKKSLALSLKEDKILWEKVIDESRRMFNKMKTFNVHNSNFCHWHRYIPEVNTNEQ